MPKRILGSRDSKKLIFILKIIFGKNFGINKVTLKKYLSVFGLNGQNGVKRPKNYFKSDIFLKNVEV